VWNLVSYIKGRTKGVCVQEYDAEEDIWAEVDRSNKETVGNHIMRCFRICTHQALCDHIKQYAVGGWGAYDTCK